MSIKCADSGCELEPDMCVEVIYVKDDHSDYDYNYVCYAHLAPWIAAYASTVKILRIDAKDLSIKWGS